MLVLSVQAIVSSPNTLLAGCRFVAGGVWPHGIPLMPRLEDVIFCRPLLGFALRGHVIGSFRAAELILRELSRSTMHYIRVGTPKKHNCQRWLTGQLEWTTPSAASVGAKGALAECAAIFARLHMEPAGSFSREHKVVFYWTYCPMLPTNAGGAACTT